MRRGSTQDLALLLQETEPLLQLAVFSVLAAGHAGLDAVLDVKRS
jgi:hypothetical protein